MLEEEDALSTLLSKGAASQEVTNEGSGVTFKMIANTSIHVGVLSAAIAILSKLVLILYAVYATSVFQVPLTSIGNFFVIYGLVAIVGAIVSLVVNENFGFHRSMLHSFALPSTGFVIMALSRSNLAFSIGAALSSVGLTIPITSVSYMGKLSKLSILVHADNSVYMRFTPFLSLTFRIANVITPAVALLFALNPHFPVMFGIGISVGFIAYYGCFVRNTTEDMEDLDIIDDSTLDWNVVTFTTMLKLALLGLSRFFSLAGNMSVQAFYIWYMSSRFGMTYWYPALQMLIGAAVASTVAIFFVKHWKNDLSADFGVLCGTFLAFGGSFGLYWATRTVATFDLTSVWGWYICMMVGHVIESAYLMSLVMLATPPSLTSTTSKVLGVLALFAAGIGPFLFSRSGFNLFLFQSILQIVSLIFCTLFFFVLWVFRGK